MVFQVERCAACPIAFLMPELVSRPEPPGIPLRELAFSIDVLLSHRMQKALLSLRELTDRVSMVAVAPREIPVVMVIGQRPGLPAHPRLSECNDVVYRLAPRRHIEGVQLSCGAAQAMPCNPAPPDVLAC